ncbi:putative MFS family arabinose efflux permease [Ilumatobacter fluminis]|uniref:Putative MFS family arabinose efflux permease n=1 Tax=Ilumatobacter fluminis TaxID=467091 RepID=A0A4R7I465_9ACTN|nr:MFS transporter [Ilumatobacter fluminis]TDT17749.1 putative MFS family arabinose efflux permease [Ilumatobacter fluminis]
MTTGALRRRLYALAFVDEFGPVYAVWTLWFNDNDVSTGQISTAFLIWALIVLVLEIPSGALADRVDRRRLLAAAFAVRAAALSVWLIWPTVGGLLVGTTLWALHDALASGTWEAMIHDQLTAVDDERSYPTVMARISQFSNLGVAAGTLLGAVLLSERVGIVVGLATLGWLTVAAHAGSISLVTTMPDVRWVTDTGEPTSFRAYVGTLRAGVGEAKRVPVIGKLVVLGALLEGLFLFDEYVPLLSRTRGGSDGAAPLIVFVVWVALLVGGEIAARRPDVRGVTVGSALILGTGITATALLTEPVWTLALVAVGYGIQEVAWIPTDARLQERASPRVRATVTSVRGFGSGVVSMTFFAVVAVMSDGDDPTPGLLAALVLLAIAGTLVIAWLPGRMGSDPNRPSVG